MNSPMNENKCDVTVILINYNSVGFTRNCIESLEKFAPRDFRFSIVVVDNNSRAEDRAALEEFCAGRSGVRLVESVINLGFSGGNMLGAQYADGEFLWFLNNDTVLLNDNITEFVKFFKSEKKAALATGRIYDAEMRPFNSFSHLPTVTQTILGKRILEKLKPEKYPKITPDYDSPLRVGMVSGASMFVRAEHFAQIGGFDTVHFLYCEEEDLAMRFTRAGYSVFYVPTPELVHYGGQSTASNFDIDREYFISLFYYFSKHFNPFQRALMRAYYVVRNLKRTTRGLKYLRLAWFVVSFAGFEKSLRHKQKMRR